jgi:hypothetical protein
VRSGSCREPDPDPEPDRLPPVGDSVRDTARDRVGVVMGREGPSVQLRPLGGGREWDADPARDMPLTPAELLSAQLAEVSARSRHGF